MNKINLLINDEAKKIYEKLPSRNKGSWVSEAIIEKSNKKEIFTAEQQKVIDELKEKVSILERMVKDIVKKECD